MTGRWMIPQLGIHDGDSPEAKMLAIAWDGPVPRWEYVSASRRLRGYAGRMPEFPRWWTGLDAFGATAEIIHGDVLQVTWQRMGTATYSDGVRRYWQGAPTATIHIRPSVLSQVARAVQAIAVPA